MTNAEVLAGPRNRSAAILLVEDDVLVRFSTAEFLRDEGYQVLETADASEALSVLATGHSLALVLSDIRMPGSMDGVGLAARIKSHHPNLPVVLVSSHLPDGALITADRLLRKPYRPLALLELVQELTGSEWQINESTPVHPGS
jgi:CheY-like chemotaxis protein